MPISNILIINGPNLKQIGTREPEIYGSVCLTEYLEQLASSVPFSVQIRYSNSEGEIIDLIEAATSVDGIILNPGAYAHTSIAIADAIRATKVPILEVHLTNLFARESFRHQSLTAPYCKGVICGFGVESYRVALYALQQMLTD